MTDLYDIETFSQAVNYTNHDSDDVPMTASLVDFA